MSVQTVLRLAACGVFLLSPMAVMAQSAKDVKTAKGKSVILITLVNPRPDCSSLPGLTALPRIADRPTNGAIQLIVIPKDIAASNGCQLRKVPAVAVVYTPSPNYVGKDAAKIEIEDGNRSTSYSYNIEVLPESRSL